MEADARAQSTRWNILRWFCCPWFGYSDVFYASLRAFCREVVPTKPFTNTALFYKMMLESEPPPLLQNALVVFMVDQKLTLITLIRETKKIMFRFFHLGKNVPPASKKNIRHPSAAMSPAGPFPMQEAAQS